MRKIELDPEQLPKAARAAWDACAKETKALLDAWVEAGCPENGPDSPAGWPAPKGKKKTKLKQTVWKKWRTYLVDEVFFHKCAYCEAKLPRNTPHAEHFRPKGKVTLEKTNGDPAQPNAKGPKGKDVVHPGYFWLAYDWRNLVPSCERCNTSGGKDNQFPLEEGRAYSFIESYKKLAKEFTKEELEAGAVYIDEKNDVVLLGTELLNRLEVPRLLNPLLDDPSEHLRFDDMGGVFAKTIEGKESPKGVKSIKVYRLDEKLIEDARREKQRYGAASWKIRWDYFVDKGNALVQAWDEAWRDWSEDKKTEEYLEAVTTFIKLKNPKP